MRICKVDGCNNKHSAKGYCNNHYLKLLRHGDPLFEKPVKSCKVDGCNGKYAAKGYCDKHYWKYKKYGDPLYIKNEFHGMRNTPGYSVWTGMKTRCYNPKVRSYPRYGGRGITVCHKWKNSFIAFFVDMGLKPFSGAELDRRENDEGYSKDNCRWITHLENSRNRG